MNQKSFFPALFSVLFLFLIASSSGADKWVTLDSLEGKAEVQREGSTKWVPVALDAKLYNNDVVRIAKDGIGRLRWPDKTVAYMRGGSQILVNIGPPKSKKKLLNYATVFMGSVFFVIKKVLPSKEEKDIQIYTPTTVLSIRGTSFKIGVQPDDGTTSIKVLCGTVRVRCIAKNASAFLSAPFKTEISKFTAPIVASALLSTDIDSLRAWLPPHLLDAEIAKQLSESKRNKLIISGRLEEKCVILPFTNTSNYSGDWNISHTLPEMLAKNLKKENRRLDIIIADSATGTVEEIAKSKGARFVITGEVTFLDVINHAAISVQADEYKERSIGRFSIKITMYDSKGEIEFNPVILSGERTGKKKNENSMRVISKMPFDLNDEAFANSLIGNALKQVLESSVETLTRAFYE
jgi:hypothetical protein